MQLNGSVSALDTARETPAQTSHRHSSRRTRLASNLTPMNVRAGEGGIQQVPGGAAVKIQAAITDYEE
jgi:hypothetical protein